VRPGRAEPEEPSGSLGPGRLVATVDDQCVSIASYVALADEPGAAEVAVADRYQGRGIGRLLVETLREVRWENGTSA
jgi:GNAT superfamily N-acetyltransferase